MSSRFRSHIQMCCAAVAVTLTLTVAELGASSPVERPTSANSWSKPHLTVDVKNRKMVVRLAGVVLREYTLIALSDSGSAIKLAADWSDRGDKLAAVEDVHLLSAAETIPKTELDIISEETGLGKDRLQRYLPRRMVLITNMDLRIYVESDCDSAKTFIWGEIADFFGRMWNSLTGGETLYLRMSGQDAMSLFGVARDKPVVSIE